jgi:hypothetical protein
VVRVIRYSKESQLEEGLWIFGHQFINLFLRWKLVVHSLVLFLIHHFTQPNLYAIVLDLGYSYRLGAKSHGKKVTRHFKWALIFKLLMLL